MALIRRTAKRLIPNQPVTGTITDVTLSTWDEDNNVAVATDSFEAATHAIITFDNGIVQRVKLPVDEAPTAWDTIQSLVGGSDTDDIDTAVGKKLTVMLREAPDGGLMAIYSHPRVVNRHNED